MKRSQAKKPVGETRVSPIAKAVPVAAMITKMTGQLPVLAPLKSVKPNTWNPNRMNPFEKMSLRHGLKEDGWIPSLALLIWRTDEKGNVKNLIIDGEHRWEEAVALGWDQGPMVFLDGLSEAKAKEFTIKIDARRGRFEDSALTAVIKSIEPNLNFETRSLDLGISEDRLDILLKVDDIPPAVGAAGDVPSHMPSGQTSAVRTVQLFFEPKLHDEWMRLVKEAAARFKSQNTTDTVLEAMRRAVAGSPSK